MMTELIPYKAFTRFTPALPSFYWDVYSAEQRIKQICHELCKIDAYSDYLRDAINQLGKDVEETINTEFEELDEWKNNLESEMYRIVSQLESGLLQWDVQTGKYATTVDAQRDMFNDVTVHSYNNEQLESLFDELDISVDDLADCGLNVKGYALVNHVLHFPESLTDDLVYDNHQIKGIFNVSHLGTAKINSEGFVFVEEENYND